MEKEGDKVFGAKEQKIIKIWVGSAHEIPLHWLSIGVGELEMRLKGEKCT